jgi:hypothetical protein
VNRHITVGLAMVASAALGAAAVQTLHAQTKPPAYNIAEITIRLRSQDRRISPLPISATRNSRRESERTPARTPGVFRGTASSNPAPSSGESTANPVEAPSRVRARRKPASRQSPNRHGNGSAYRGRGPARHRLHAG